MVQFRFLELKGEYDFGSSNSEYKSEMMVGDAKLKVKHNLRANCAKFELEGPLWEIGYDHKSKIAHAKKKYWLTKNLQLIMRQDVPNFKFGVIPSPEIQLEHTVKNFCGLDKQKLELKYDTFWKRFTVEEEVSFKQFKIKSAINSQTMWPGAAMAIKAEPKKALADEMEVRLMPRKPVRLQYKVKPLKGLKVVLFTDSQTKKVQAEVEAEFCSQGMKIELRQLVSAKGWSQPLLGIAYKC